MKPDSMRGSAARVVATGLTMLILLLGLAGCTATTIETFLEAIKDSEGDSARIVTQFGGQTWAVAVAEEQVFLGQGPRVLAIDRDQIAHQGSMAQSDILPGIVRGMVWRSGLIYAALGEEGLYILDASTSDGFQPVGQLTGLGAVHQVAVRADQVYLAGDQFHIISVANPEDPKRLASLSMPGKISQFGLLDTYAVIGHAQGLTVVDTAIATAPNVVVQLSGRSPVQAVEIGGQYAYIGHNALVIYDLTDPTNPVEVGSLHSSGLPISQIRQVENLIYLTENFCEFGQCGGKLLAIDVTDPTHPVPAKQYPMSDQVTDLVIEAGNVFLAFRENGLQVLGLGDPTDLREVAAFDPVGSVTGLIIDDHYAYLANGDFRGLYRFEMMTPVDWRNVYKLDLAWPIHLELADGYLYLATWLDGVTIIDVKAERNLVQIDTGPLLSRVAGNLFLSQGTLYTVDPLGSLSIFDITYPEQPGFLADLALQDSYTGLLVRGRHIYLSGSYLEFDDQRGHILQVVDGSDLTRPIPVTSLKLSEVEGGWQTSTQMAVAQNYLYITMGNCLDQTCSGKLSILSLDDSAAPQIIGSLDLPAHPTSLVVAGDLLLITVAEAGLIVYDIVRPDTPRWIAHIDTPGDARGVFVHNGFLYIADGAGGVVVLQISSIS